MAVIETLHAFDDEARAYLRDVLEAYMPPEAVAGAVARLQTALADGTSQVALLRDAAGVPGGIAAWMWRGDGQWYVVVTLLHADGGADEAEQLVDHVFAAVQAVPTLEAMDVRVRGESAAVRVALARRQAVIFERCSMVYNLAAALPEVAAPEGYAVVPWVDAHWAGIEVAALAGQAGTVDEVVVPETAGGRILDALRELRAGTYAGLGLCYEPATLVVLAPDGSVAGYVIVNAVSPTDDEPTGAALISDILVHPAHRRRGLGRLLMVRSMAICAAAGIPSMMLGVTSLNPARLLYDALGFSQISCGEQAIWWRDGRQHTLG